MEAGQRIGFIRFEHHFVALVAHDQLVAGLAFHVQHNLVAHRRGPLDRHPLGVFLLHIGEIFLDPLIGDLFDLVGQPHSTIVAQVHFRLDGHQDRHAEGVPLHFFQFADLVGFNLDLFERLLIQLVAEILQGLLLDGFPAKDAHHGVKRRSPAPVTWHVELPRELASRLAQFLVNLGRIQLDDGLDLTVF